MSKNDLKTTKNFENVLLTSLNLRRSGWSLYFLRPLHLLLPGYMHQAKQATLNKKAKIITRV